MSLNSEMDLMRQVPFFADFTDDQLRLLAFGAETRSYRAKQVLFRQGDLADSAFIVLDGEIRMTISSDGRDLDSQHLYAGSLIGELALVAETRRTAMAIAVEDLRVIQIRRSLFRRVMDEYPELAEEIHARMSSRLTNLVADLQQVVDMLDGVPQEAASMEDAMTFAMKD
ncbi:MAG: cyclic nucleotide-binding domain-containing protein [Cohaesibacter sp.]|nr:cyclic nucleotide-binding domain-containing protein [Cohaesibacter sp.]MCV6574292.1 cyclic nucleotide-binding domain-containing protein [Cohaesibacter sp.]MCV6601643.1 cyclic nucleotide-binding domain-containing protein [Cohaesibacter sp.]